MARPDWWDRLDRALTMAITALLGAIFLWIIVAAVYYVR